MQGWLSVIYCSTVKPPSEQKGHGTIYAYDEFEKDLAKMAFAIAVKVKDDQGADVPPFVEVSHNMVNKAVGSGDDV